MLQLLKDKDQQSIADALVEGFTTLAPLEMNRVLQECGYEYQRNISERHVAVLADLMTRGQWQPKSQIDFAYLNGRYILINGYHRAYAQVRSGKTIQWTIAIHRVKAETELRSLYHAFDTNIRIRGNRDILRAAEFAETYALPAEMAASLYQAVPYLASKFATRQSDKKYLIERQVDRRLEVATAYAKAAGRFSACMEGMSGSRRTRLKGGAITAVAVATFRFQNETAWTFWSGVAQNDGLKKGDPRLALVTDLMMRRTAGGGNNALSFGPAIIAWNAFFNERELRAIKVMDSFVPVIDGTPFNGKWDK